MKDPEHFLASVRRGMIWANSRPGNEPLLKWPTEQQSGPSPKQPTALENSYRAAVRVVPGMMVAVGIVAVIGWLVWVDQREVKDREEIDKKVIEVKQNYGAFASRSTTLTGMDLKAFQLVAAERQQEAEDATRKAELEDKVSRCSAVLAPEECRKAFECDSDPVQCVLSRDLDGDVLQAMREERDDPDDN